MPFKQQSGLVNIPLKQWPYICKKYNHNQLQTKDITLILILGMGITRRKPVALTRNMVTLWRRSRELGRGHEHLLANRLLQKEK